VLLYFGNIYIEYRKEKSKWYFHMICKNQSYKWRCLSSSVVTCSFGS